MGTYIDSAATAYRRGHLFGRGALHLSDVAARACLSRGHHDASELDILVNAGIYKDRNAVEPALASIIQEDIGANLGHPPRIGRHGTFSFDVVDGGCGVLTAAQLVDTFVGRGVAHLGMVVAADADPSPRTSRGFRFSPAGGALLLAHDDGVGGFQRFEHRTFVAHVGMFDARLSFDRHAGITHRGRNVLAIYEAPAFAWQCVEDASEAVSDFLVSEGLRAGDIDLLVASQYPPGFATSLALRVGIPPEGVPHVRRELIGAHTAGPIAALEAAIASGRFARAHTTLFVTAGAGISIAIALYHHIVAPTH